MDGSKEDLELLISQSMDQATLHLAEETLQQLLGNPAIVPLLFQIVGDPESSVRQAAATYLYKAVTGVWESISPTDRQQVRCGIMELFCTAPPLGIMKRIIHLIEFVINNNNDEGYDEILAFLVTDLAEWKQIPIVMIIAEVGSLLPECFLIENHVCFLTAAENVLGIDNDLLSLNCCKVAYHCSATAKSFEFLAPFMEKLLEIAGRSACLQSDELFNMAWELLCDASHLIQQSPPHLQAANELFHELIFSPLDVSRRYMLLEFLAVEVGLGVFADEEKGGLLELLHRTHWMIFEEALEVDTTIQFGLDSVVEMMSKTTDLELLGGKLIEICSESLATESPVGIITGMFFLGNATRYCTDVFYDKQDFVVSIIGSAIASEQPILLEAAVFVIMNLGKLIVEYNKLPAAVLPMLIAWCFHENEESSTNAYDAICCICEHGMSTVKVPGLLDLVWENCMERFEARPERFLAVLGHVLMKCPQLDNQDFERIVEFMKPVFSNLTTAVSLIEHAGLIATKLCLHSDTIKTEIVMTIFLPLLGALLESSELRERADGFFTTLVSVLTFIIHATGPFCCEVIGPLCPALFELTEIYQEYELAALFVQICEHWSDPEFPVAAYVCELLKYLFTEDSMYDIVKIQVADKLSHLYKFLDPPSISQLATPLVQAAASTEDTTVIWRALGEMLAYADDQCKKLIIMNATTIIWEQLTSQVGPSGDGLEFLKYSMKVDKSCNWLEKLPKMYAEYPPQVKCEIIGFMGDLVSDEEFQAEHAAEMLQALTIDMMETSEFFRQDTTYFMNRVITYYPDFAPVLVEKGIMEVVNAWYTDENATEMLKDTIASFLMSILNLLDGLDESLFSTALDHYLPEDHTEIEEMTKKMIALGVKMQTASNELKCKYIVKLSELVTMTDSLCNLYSVSPELLDAARRHFKGFIVANDFLMAPLLEVCGNYEDKMVKLEAIMQMQ